MSISRPLRIGLSPRFQHHFPTDFGVQQKVVQYLEQSISHWVTEAGALSFMIPSVSEKSILQPEFIDPNDYARELDALILQGGADVGTDLIRDRFELDLIKAFHTAGKPILGVCRGMQLLNVYFGGSLMSDIGTVRPGSVAHFKPDLYDRYTHAIDIVGGGMLNFIYGDVVKNLHVVSIHHQAVDMLGNDLQVEAISKDDGIIEAFSHKGDAFVLGVQWHPEFHYTHPDTALPSAGILSAILDSARVRRRARKARPLVRNVQRLEVAQSETLTIGVEIELQLIDPATHDLKGKSIPILETVKDQTSKIKSEIFQSMIEVETGICRTAIDAEKDLSETIAILKNAANEHGVKLAGCGTHPFAHYLERSVTPGNERYTQLIERNQWIARRLVIFGLHVHVGMPNQAATIKIMNAYMMYAPLLLGLSASSPFWHNDDTGLASSRSTIFESTPTGGHPVIIDSWGEYEDLYFKMLNSGSVTSPKDLWWDIRPSPHYGTLEIRICDVMPSLKENIALAALIQSMAAHFIETAGNGIQNPSPTDWQYRENKWRATRHGLEFDYVMNDWGETRPAKEVLKELLTKVSTAPIPIDGKGATRPAGEIYAESFSVLNGLIDGDSAYARQRRVFKETGSIQDVVKENCREFEQNAPNRL